MVSSAPAQALRRPTMLAALAGFVLLGSLSAWGWPVVDRLLNPAATAPGLISFLGVGLTVLALTALLLFYGLRRLLPRGGIFLAAAFGYNALLIAVKLGLGPIAIYAQNSYYRAHALPRGGTGADPGFSFLTTPFAYPGLAAMMAILYGGAFLIIYLIFHTRLGERLQLPMKIEQRFLRLLVTMFVLGVVGGLTIIGLLGFLEYAASIAYAGTVAVLIAIALTLAISLCTLAFQQAAEQAALTRNVTLVTTFAWIGLSFIAVYHILWVVFVVTCISLWPLKPWAYVGGGAK